MLTSMEHPELPISIPPKKQTLIVGHSGAQVLLWEFLYIIDDVFNRF